jgi:hypothetical protein
VAGRLLDWQIALLDYLTSGATIFGVGDKTADGTPCGANREMLRLEALFSHQKRMEKIREALPKTFELLGTDQDRVVRKFAARCPPVDISGVVNARRSPDFLSSRRRYRGFEPPYLLDRRPEVVLLRCAFDVRSIFEDDEQDIVPLQCDTPIAVTRELGIRQHRIFELPLFIFDFPGALDDWTNPAEFNAISQLQDLIRELSEQGLRE